MMADAGPDSFNLNMEMLSDEENMEPTGNAVKNPIRLNNGIDYNDLIIGDNKIRNEETEAERNLISGNAAEEQNIAPAVNHLENLDQVEDIDDNNLIIGNKTEADNQAEIGKQDADLLNQAFIMTKRKKGIRKKRR